MKIINNNEENFQFCGNNLSMNINCMIFHIQDLI